MRILWLSHFLPYPPKGGALQRSHHLLRQAASRHEVHLVALSQRAILKNDDAVAEAERELRPMVRSLRWFPISSDSARWRWSALVLTTYLRSAPYDVTWLRNAALGRHLETLLNGPGFDLTHVDTIGLWPYAEMFHDTPAILNHHNVESHMMARRANLERSPLRRAYFSREAEKLGKLEKVACLKASVNLVVSELDGDRLQRVVPGCRTRVVENGVDVEYFLPEPEARTRPGSLTFVGGMNWYPNREAVLFFIREVWPLLLMSNQDRTVTFVGQDPPPELLQLGDQRVRAPGFVDDVRPYLREAEIFICPILNGGGTRLKILDALAMARPLVATTMAVEGLLLVDGEHYLRADHPDEFVAMIDRLAADPELRRRLGTNGRRLVERRYSWPSIGRSLEEAYTEAATSRTEYRMGDVPERTATTEG